MGSIIDFPQSPQLFVNEIVGYAGAGTSAPLQVIASDGQHYILKPSVDGYSSYFKHLSQFCELTAFKVANQLQMEHILPGEPRLIYLDDIFFSLAQQAHAQEIISRATLSNLQKSLGINLGIPFISNAMPITSLEDLPIAFARLVVLLDAYIGNSDRTPLNTNLIYDPAQHVHYAIDFGYSFHSHMLFYHIYEGNLNESAIIQDKPIITPYHVLQNTPIFHPRYALQQFFPDVTVPRNHKLSEDDAYDIISSYPSDWAELTKHVISDVARYLSDRVGKREALKICGD